MKCWLYYTSCTFQGENGFCQYFLLVSVFSFERQSTFQRRLSSTSVKLLLSYTFASTNLFPLYIKTKNLSRYILILGLMNIYLEAFQLRWVLSALNFYCHGPLIFTILFINIFYFGLDFSILAVVNRNIISTKLSNFLFVRCF